MSESPSAIKRIAAGAASATAVATLLAACSVGSGESAPKPTPTTAAPAPRQVPETTPTTYGVSDYLVNKLRNQELEAAVDKFGGWVIAASQNKSNTWGPFDAYCSPQDSTSTGPEGWVSQSFKPRPGDACAVQHHPDYGGSSTSLSALVEVGPDGGYTNTFFEASINSPDCRAVDIRFDSVSKTWETSYMNASHQIIEAQSAQTAADAEGIDYRALDCLYSINPNPPKVQPLHPSTTTPGVNTTTTTIIR